MYKSQEFSFFFSSPSIFYNAIWYKSSQSDGAISTGDPPFFIVNFGKNRKPKNIADFHHNPMHAKVLKQKGDELKIKNVVYAMGIGIIDPSNTGMVEFIIEQLN